MPKQQTSKKRTQVKALPKKDKKLSEGDMKKIKGGAEWDWNYNPSNGVVLKKPGATK